MAEPALSEVIDAVRDYCLVLWPGLLPVRLVVYFHGQDEPLLSLPIMGRPLPPVASSASAAPKAGRP